MATPRLSASILVRVDGDMSEALRSVRSIIQRIAPEAPVEMGRAADLLRDTIATQRFTMGLLAALAFLAAVLASVGLYAVVAHGVGSRIREIGIRISLGARSSEITWMMVRGGTGAVTLGVLMGAVLSLAGDRVIGSMLYGVEAGDFMALAGAVGLQMMATLAATVVPAHRAVHVDPVRAIQKE
jgi:ABC-type antimicrobial peptide transport system permease subunit